MVVKVSHPGCDSYSQACNTPAATSCIRKHLLPVNRVVPACSLWTEGSPALGFLLGLQIKTTRGMLGVIGTG